MTKSEVRSQRQIDKNHVEKSSVWQCCECQQVVDCRLVAVQRWIMLSNQTPSVIVVRRKGRLVLNVGDIFQRGVILARPYQLSIQEHDYIQFRASGCTVCM